MYGDPTYNLHNTKRIQFSSGGASYIFDTSDLETLNNNDVGFLQIACAGGSAVINTSESASATEVGYPIPITNVMVDMPAQKVSTLANWMIRNATSSTNASVVTALWIRE